MRLARLVFWNLAGAAVLLLALEGISRLVYPVDFPDPLITKVQRRGNWSENRRYDPLLFWVVTPNIVRGGEQKSNSLGLRGPELPPKAPGEFRILSLGESTTYAGRLRYEETYSARVEQLLARQSARPVRVVNAGVPGYTLFQGVTYLRERGLALEPDAVMIYFGYNDSLPVAFRAHRDAAGRRIGLTDRELFEQRRTLRYRIAYALQVRSNLARIFSFSSLTSGKPPAPVKRDMQQARVPEDDRSQLLGELRQLCREHGLRLVVLVPWYREHEAHAPLLRTLAGTEDVLVVDLPVLLADVPEPRASYFDDPLHPTAEGHRLLAEAIAAALTRDPKIASALATAP